MKRPLRIFLVDDNEDFLEMLKMVIEARGYEVETAGSGEEAIEKFRRRDFDIAFMDVKLPGKNGVESFLEIRKFKPHAKVVMMTGYSVEQLLKQAVENGAWGVLQKPLNPERVFELILAAASGGILIADDDADFIASLKELLTGKGKKVLVARNGREAVERISAGDIDILILDLRMPILNGLETYLELKKMGRAVPTIIVTAYAREEWKAISQMKEMSVTEILRKPFDPKDLLEAIKRLTEAEN